MTFIRKEFLRAHTLVTRCLSSSIDATTPHSPSPGDPLDPLGAGHTIKPEQLLTLLCEPTDPPSFSLAAKTERAHRKNTLESLDLEGMDL
jgi:hypothetical protein